MDINCPKGPKGQFDSLGSFIQTLRKQDSVQKHCRC